MKLLVRLLLGLVLFVLLAALAGWIYFRQSLPELDGDVALAGLEAEVTVERDSLGVVHVRAASRADASRALGFVHAQERMFQMDLLRRAAAGELAALLGPRLVSTDSVLRPHGFRATAGEVAAALPEGHRQIVDAYAEGVNAGLAALGARPFEYAALRQTPEPWRPEDSFLVAYAMYLDLQRSDLDDELDVYARDAALPPALSRFVDPGGDEWDAPLVGDPVVPPPPPAPDSLGMFRPGPSRVAGGDLAANMDALRTDALRAGSNNWAVAGERTASGAALVANDMHLGLSLPHIWFRAAMTTPDRAGGERTLAGLTLPGTPLFIVGSNGSVAWGFTNSYGDYADLVRLVRQPGLRNVIQTASGDVTVDTLRETIHVAGGEPVGLAVPVTPWGPVLYRDGNGDEYAVQWGAHRAEASNLHLIELEGAKTLEEALDVANRVGIPAQNFTAGDREGRIGWTLAGQIPRRIGRDGQRPVDSTDPNARWSGFLSPDEVPRVVEPPAGILWTANNRTMSGDALALIGDGGYASGARARQIRDRLRALRQPATPQDMLDIQLDDRALFLSRWRDLMERTLSSAPPKTSRASTASPSVSDRLAGWTGRATPDDPAYGLVKRFRQHVGAGLAESLLGDAQDVYGGANSLTEAALWTLVSERPEHLLPSDAASWEAFLRDAAERAITDSPATWGDENTAEIEHPMADALPLIGGWLRMPADRLAGDGMTPRVAAPSFGASQRMAVSPGHEADGILHMPGGQSGHPLSPYWGAGHDAWVEGRPLPFLPGRPKWSLRLVPASR